MRRVLVLVVLLAGLVVLPGSPHAGATPATRPACEGGYGGPHPLPPAGCLKLRVPPPTRADIDRIADQWSVPAQAVVTIHMTDMHPVGSLYMLTFRWQ